MSAGVVAALAAEARTLGSSSRRSDGLSAIADGTLFAVSGMGCRAASAAAGALADAGATALVSWGMAGGLDPALSAGTICLPDVVMSCAGESFSTDAHWRAIIVAALAAGAVHGKLLTSPRAIEDVAGKAAAFRDTGAAAVDMESVAVAAVAAGRGLPFIAVRVVVDTAADSLPDAVLGASTAGQVNLARLLWGLVRAPQELAPLIRLGLRYRAARRALVAVARTGTLSLPMVAVASANRIA